jgi:uncharacterized membrane protein YvlD (DUF360 family)
MPPFMKKHGPPPCERKRDGCSCGVALTVAAVTVAIALIKVQSLQQRINLTNLVNIIAYATIVANVKEGEKKMQFAPVSALLTLIYTSYLQLSLYRFIINNVCS